MDVVLEHLQWGWDNGVHIPILGKGEEFNEKVKFFPCMLALVGDDPALNREVGVYEGNPTYGCRYGEIIVNVLKMTTYNDTPSLCVFYIILDHVCFASVICAPT